MTSKCEDAQHARAPVGVFDSGVGGLTVLRALASRLPQEDFVYLGDTARLPYGTKSPQSIRRYALQAADYLKSRGVKCLVVACNTASAVALDALAEEFAPIPVLGVLEPGAAAACQATRSGRIAISTTCSARAGPTGRIRWSWAVRTSRWWRPCSSASWVLPWWSWTPRQRPPKLSPEYSWTGD